MEQMLFAVGASIILVGAGFFILQLYRCIVAMQAQIDFLYKRAQMHEIRLQHIDGIADDGDGPLMAVTDYWPTREGDHNANH